MKQTKSDLKAVLQERGVSFKSKATLAELEQLVADTAPKPAKQGRTASGEY